jgi:mannosyl-oligosaccharide alpha-1,3-glucosidase
MQQTLASHGRRMVTIIDPHIKRDSDYYIHKEATAKGLYIKDKDGKSDYDGWCWPGSSSYLDFTAEHVRSWWADQFSYKKYQGSTPTLFTWNDMNEPSVFNGPEVSMQKDLKNLNGAEHREWHNLYGMLFHRATGEGQIRRNDGQDIRPFVLSRSFFAGSQRYGAIWTGDNTADWGHFEVAAPMLLSLNVAALSFVGADVGGFFGNPDAELFTRWMQAAAFQPFFRGHAHHDSKRREPWMFGDETLVRLRQAAMSRYALLPYWYTVFYEAEQTGMPVMRTMWMQYPNTEELFNMDDQYLVGSDLLVKPITKQGETETNVSFPLEHLWYDVESLEIASDNVAPGNVESSVVQADIEKIPVFQRGGSIIPRKLRLRRSTMMMKTDPYTLYIALDEKNQSIGRLHIDDEETFGYIKRNEYADASFKADFALTRRITNSVVVGSGWAEFDGLQVERMIERIIVMGVKDLPTHIEVAETGEKLDFSLKSEILVIRKPGLSVLADWTIALSF